MDLKLVGIFLTRFDVKRGNVVEWEKNCSHFEGLEFKSMPAGIHQFEEDVVTFRVFQNGKSLPYYGVSYFKQNGFELQHDSHGQISREDLLMYSLGVIVDTQVSERANTSIFDCGLVAEQLQKLLIKWLEGGELDKFEIFTDFYDKWAGQSKEPTDSEDEVRGRRSLIDYCPFWLKQLGPLIFPIWKSILLGEKILILNLTGSTSEICSSLCFFLSLLCKAMDIKLSGPGGSEFPGTPIRQILYSVCVSDIDALYDESVSANGFIAYTSDDILTFHKDLYNKVLKLELDDIFTGKGGEPGVRLLDNDGEEIRATPHELEMYEAFLKTKLDKPVPESETHRLIDLTEPVTWLQTLIDGVYFWTTAGTVKPAFHRVAEEDGEQKQEQEQEQEQNKDNDAYIGTILNGITGARVDKEIAANTLLYFQRGTRKLYNVLNTLITVDLSDDEKPVVISPLHFPDMGLDCFSEQDRNFIKKLSAMWFNKEVEIHTIDCLKLICYR